MIYNLIKGIGSWGSDTLTAKMALGMSILTIALVLSMQNTPCISASSCVVGDSETFSGTLKINSGNNFGHTLSGTATTDRILTMPDVSGELLVGNFTGNANKIMQVNTGANAVEYGFVDPLTQIDITSGGTQTPLAGQLLQVNTGANALTFGNVGIANINDSGVAGQFLKSSGSALSFSKIDITDSTQIDIGTGTSGQILSVNQSGTALEYGPLPASAGSFQATAAQNVVAGTVGIETNGQVRNITTLQNGTSALLLSEGQVQTTKPNSLQVHSFYNSNIDANVVFYRDYDSANDATCNTHTYVDVVIHASSTITNWGRQCVSNEWANHTSSYANQVATYQTLAQTTAQNMMVRRYGRETDESIDDYVLLYFGQQQQDGQVWGIPVSINSSNNTIVVGTEALIHDENTCYSNGSCSSVQSNYDINNFTDMVFTSGQDNKMYFWWQQYHGGYNAANYGFSHKSFTCSNLGQVSASCSPDNNFKRESQTNYLKQYNQANHPEIVWDHTAQTFMAMTHYDSYNWKITQFRLQEGVNNTMSFGTYGSSLATHYTGGTTYTDSTNNLTFQVNSGAYGCVNGYNSNSAIYDEDVDVWMFPCYYHSAYNNYDTYGTAFIIASADTSNYTGAPTIHNYWSSQHALGIDPTSSSGCSAVPNFECKDRPLNTIFGNYYYDTTAHVHYWYTPKHQKNGGCIDGYGNRCMAVWQWEVDPTTKGVLNSSFKEFTFQNADGTKYYNHFMDHEHFLYKDKGDNVLIAGFHYGDQSATEKWKLAAQAFVIPDNIATWIGYATQGGNQGASVTVYSIGAVIDGLNGLTIGTEYYVKDDGSLGTSGTYKIGRAIATDKIYITNAR